ncbi:MAG: hypothetical protein WCG79_10395 [Verrucomicrobiota bacterium]
MDRKPGQENPDLDVIHQWHSGNGHRALLARDRYSRYRWRHRDTLCVRPASSANANTFSLL